MQREGDTLMPGQVYQITSRRFARPTTQFQTQVTASLAAQKIAQVMWDYDRDTGATGPVAVNDLEPHQRNRYYRHAEASLRRLDANAMLDGAVAGAQALVDFDNEIETRKLGPFPELRSMRPEEQVRALDRAKRTITAYEKHLQDGVAS
jgi:hypothetical protein